MTPVPKTLRQAEVRAERLALIHAPHMESLTHYVETLRRLTDRPLGIPSPDPLDGGVQARALLLLEAPGGRAAAGDGGAGSGFVSRDNPDETAKRLLLTAHESGLERRDTLIWNIVPWYVGAAGRIRAVASSEVREGRVYLRELLALLPHLQVVVTLGRPAALGWAPLRAEHPQLLTLASWHPSTRALAGFPDRSAHLKETLRLTAKLVAHTDLPGAPSWS